MVHRFRASRLSPGNRLFPTVLEVSHRHVSRIKASMVGQIEESISIRQVSSVTIARGTVWSEIVVHSSGGTDPLYLRAATELGATTSLQKPFASEELLTAVAGLLPRCAADT